MPLGLLQLSLGILGVLSLGLLNRLLMQDIQLPAVLAALALLLMVWAGSEQSIPVLRAVVGLFGLSLEVCTNACLTLMFSFVQPLGVVVHALLDRVVNPNRVDRGAARLHLALAPMDSGLVVHELSRQMKAAITPRQPEVVAGK